MQHILTVLILITIETAQSGVMVIAMKMYINLVLSFQRMPMKNFLTQLIYGISRAKEK